MDLTAVLAEVTAAGDSIESVGLAIIGVAAVVFAYRWIKASFF